MKNKKGFSFVRLLITLAIIGILAAMVIAKYHTLNKLRQMQTRQTLQQLQSPAPDNAK